MEVLIVEPYKEPYIKEISAGLSSLQHEVGGSIEAVYPFDDLVALICNEEGKILGLDLNRALRGEDGEIYDIISGTFMVVGLGEEDFTSLSPEMAQKYLDHFKMPELFINTGNSIKAIPFPPERQNDDLEL